MHKFIKLSFIICVIYLKHHDIIHLHKNTLYNDQIRKGNDSSDRKRGRGEITLFGESISSNKKQRTDNVFSDAQSRINGDETSSTVKDCKTNPMKTMESTVIENRIKLETLNHPVIMHYIMSTKQI